MSHALRAIVTIAAFLTFAVPVSAQQGRIADTGSATVTDTSAQSSVIPGPTMASATLAMSAPGTTALGTTVAPFEPSTRNTALMIVGGAGLVLGAVVGGDEGTIIMIAGGGVGLWGLWRHLR